MTELESMVWNLYLNPATITTFYFGLMTGFVIGYNNAKGTLYEAPHIHASPIFGGATWGLTGIIRGSAEPHKDTPFLETVKLKAVDGAVLGAVASAAGLTI